MRHLKEMEDFELMKDLDSLGFLSKKTGKLIFHIYEFPESTDVENLREIDLPAYVVKFEASYNATEDELKKIAFKRIKERKAEQDFSNLEKVFGDNYKTYATSLGSPIWRSYQSLEEMTEEYGEYIFRLYVGEIAEVFGIEVADAVDKKYQQNEVSFVFEDGWK